MSGSTKIMRGSKEFEEWARNICKDRFVSRDKKLRGIPRLQKAITRVPKLRDILVEASFDDK